MTFRQGADPGLPPEQLEEIFQQIIVPDYLLRSNPEPQQHPEAVLLGGQPGAGKSTASHFHREFASRGSLVWVTWDDYRPFHPEYERLLQQRPADMPDVTRPAARWWQDRAAAYLRAGRYHVLLEGGFRDPTAVLATAERFAEAGYQVRICALAVPAALSRLGIIERYARQVEVAGTGRWTTAASHDADYTGTVEVLHRPEGHRRSHGSASSPATARSTTTTATPPVSGPAEPLRSTSSSRPATAHWPDSNASPWPTVWRNTLDRLERADNAQSALHEMATEVERAVGRSTPFPPAAHPHEPTTSVWSDTGRTLDAATNFDLPAPGSSDPLNLEL